MKKKLQLFIRKVVGQEQDVFGRVVNKTDWVRATEDISLGSVSHPKNQDIMEFEWR